MPDTVISSLVALTKPLTNELCEAALQSRFCVLYMFIAWAIPASFTRYVYLAA
jgi:hypothetical protein